MSESGRFLSPLAHWWQQAALGQRVAAGLCVLICVGAIIGLAAFSARPNYATLYSGLQEKDLGDVVAKLKESKTPYQLRADGSVSVPAEKVYELRLTMATAGLPKGGSVGYEIFDQNRLGGSEFQEKLNYQRALQGELERTIMSFGQVARARVHIAMPERALFTQYQEKPTASVMLSLRPGLALGENEVNAIVHLVSSSVEGLPRENVTVVDTNGALLSSPSGDSPLEGGASQQVKLQAGIEDRLQRDLDVMLTRIVGPGRALTKVNADLDFDQRQAQEETYKPANADHGVLESQRENRESYNGTRPSASGTPGVRTTTTPASAATTLPASAATSTSRADGYERVESDIRYRVSKRMETVTNTPGQVRRLSVAVFLDDAAKLPDLSGMQQALAAAAGIDEARGDRLVIQRVPFAVDAQGSSREGLGSRLTGLFGSSGRNLVALALLGVFLFLARGLMRSPGGFVPASATAVAGVGQHLSLTSGETARPGLPAPSQAASPPGFDADRAAQVIREWLLAREGN